MDKRLHKNFLSVKSGLKVQDKDFFLVVDGAEGGGKSVLAMQIAAFVDPSFVLERVCFTPDAFREVVVRASRGQAVVFDEAFTGLSSRSSLSRVNRLLVSLMMEMRQKNLFVIIVLPSFFLLDKYVALWRSKALVHVRTKSGKRGFFTVFNSDNKKLLYLFGRQDYTYQNKRVPKTGFNGRFLNQYVVDEKLYRLRKKKALGDKNLFEVDDYFVQRNKLLLCLSEEFGLSMRKLSELVARYGVRLARNSVSVAINSVKGSVVSEGSESE